MFDIVSKWLSAGPVSSMVGLISIIIIVILLRKGQIALLEKLFLDQVKSASDKVATDNSTLSEEARSNTDHLNKEIAKNIDTLLNPESPIIIPEKIVLHEEFYVIFKTDITQTAQLFLDNTIPFGMMSWHYPSEGRRVLVKISEEGRHTIDIYDPINKLWLAHTEFKV
jgi:hypothetical protein